MPEWTADSNELTLKNATVLRICRDAMACSPSCSRVTPYLTRTRLAFYDVDDSDLAFSLPEAAGLLTPAFRIAPMDEGYIVCWQVRA